MKNKTLSFLMSKAVSAWNVSVRYLCVAISMLVCASVSAGLPDGWTDIDIGAPSQTGSASYSSGSWTVSGGGADIWGSSDQFNFAYTNSSGDQTIVAQVTSIANSDSWAKAGVMFRNDNQAYAMFVDVVVTPGNGVTMQWRSAVGSDCASSMVSGAVPVWVKLVRSGNDFSGYYSSDGTSWTLIGSSVNISMNTAVLAGLAVTAHNDSLLCQASLSNVNVSANNVSQKFPSCGIYREMWTDLNFGGGNSIANFTNSASFPNSPNTSYTRVFSAFETEVNSGINNYGQRLRAYILPPADGDYTFWISSDDASQLFLSTDENPQNKYLIASVNNWTSSRVWTSEANQQSAAISLVGGRRYYIEALMQQGNGGDNLAVRWQLPDGSMEEPIAALPASGPRLLPINGTVTKPVVFSQTASVDAVEGASATASVLATNASALSYQWWFGGALLSGATNPVCTRTSVTVADSGKAFQCVVSNSLGAATSAPIVLTVVADTQPPTVAGVYNVGLTNVQITFSKPVELASATTPGNYVFTNGMAVTAVSLAADTKTVNLTTAPMVYGSNYVILISNVRDRATTPNTIPANTPAAFTALQLAVQDVGIPSTPSTFIVNGDTMSLTSTGGDIGGSVDQFGFSYKTITGNFDISVRLSGLSASDAWAKAGLMARETLDKNSRYAAALATPAMCGSFFSVRTTAGGTATTAGSLPVNYPDTWLRLKRVGSMFLAYASFDGQTWTLLGSSTVSMASQIYVGMAVTSHSSSLATTAQFGEFVTMQGAVITGTQTDSREPLGPSSRKTPIVISEIMYKPAPRSDSNNLEFIEIYNSNPYFHDISGYKLAGAVDYTFPANTIIQAGEFKVIAAMPSDVEQVYTLNGVFGPYTGSLKKSGTLQLLDEKGAVLLTVPYSDIRPWPVAATGTGHSLVLANPTYGEEDPRAWEISSLMGGSPGKMDAFRPTSLKNVKINEILAHTEDPAVPDFIELYNHSTVTNDISGCILTDDPSTNRFIIPAGTIMAAKGFVSFDQAQLGFGLSAKGGTIYLIDPNHTRVLDALQYEAQADGVSFGRYPDGADELYALSARTAGSANAPGAVGDIVINELMYDPISGNDDDQYIELYNKGTNTVNLSNWRFTSGVTFTFPTNASIAPDGYVVVARNIDNLFAKYTNLNASNTYGSYSGKLSHNGDRVVLAMPQPLLETDSKGVITTNTLFVEVDEVTYGVGGRWGQWAAGGGSSLELIDPRSNHRLPSNWGDSDETSKSSWTNIETTGVLDNGANYNSSINYVAIGLLDVGECLIDNVEVVYNNKNYVSNSTFESGTTGWYFEGCMVRSGLENSGYSSSRSMHIRCSSRLWTGANACSTYLNTTTLQEGNTVTLRFKARWLRGWPEPLMRLSGNWLEATGKMPVPQNLGTPGQPNSRAAANVGPAIYQITHTPSLPDAGTPAVVTARVDDPDGVKSLTLYYRIDPQTSYTAVTMRDDGQGGDAVAGDGLYSATVPGQSANTMVPFYIQSVDSQGASTRFPALLTDGNPTREALILFGDNHTAGAYGVYHLWVSQSTSARWSSLPNLSNETHDGTVVNGKRVIYNARARFAGSPYHQNFNTPDGNLCHYKWDFPDDDKFLGATSFNKIHQPGNGAGDDASLQREQVANSFLRALHVPWLYRRHVAVYVNGNQRGQLMEDAQTPDSDIVKENFPNDKDGWLYKMQPWFEFDINNTSSSVGFNMPSWCTIMPFTTTGGVKKMARYRWDFLVRRTPDSCNNFTNVYRVVDAASTYGTTNYAARMKSVADMENWMRVFAANHAAGNWDSFGAQNAQNMYGYAGVGGTKYTLMMFDFNISIGNSGSWGPGENLFTYNGSDSNVGNIYNEPEFRRMYWRALQELVDGPLNVANSGSLLDAKYAAMTGSGFSVENPTAIKNWLTSARSSIASQLSSVNATAFTVNSSVVSNNMVYLSGTAPMNVKTIWINGEEVPLYWSALQTWTAAVPLSAGTNTLSVIGVNMQGTPITGASNTVTVVSKAAPVSPAGKVVINEIMFNPQIPGAEYVELYNNSTNLSFDLSGMQFHGLSYTFPNGSVIAPGSYLVLAADRMVFASVYGTGISVFDTFDGTLQLDGETLSLIQPGTNGVADAYVARVRYESTVPWSTNAFGSGSSLQLIDPTQDNWRVCNWTAEATNAQPEMQWVYATANIGTPPSASTTFYIYLKSAGDVYLDDMTLVKNGTTTSILQNGNFESTLTGPWSVSSSFSQSALSSTYKHNGNSSLHMVAASGGSGSGNSISQSVTGLDTSSSYVLGFWYRQSTNGGPLTLRFSSRTSTELDQSIAPPGAGVVICTPGSANSVAASLTTFQSLWINELQDDNVTGITNSLGQHAGWIEIYNPSTNSISTKGLYLANQYTNLVQWAFPTNGVIAPGEFKVIYADGETNLQTTSEWHANFTLARGAGSVALGRVEGENVGVLDFVNYTNLQSNHSYGSFPDGQSFSRQEFYYVSPGGTNNGSSAPLTVSINEWMAGNTMTIRNPVGSKYDDWFELYNYGTNTVDLSGYYLTHSLTNQFEFKIPAGYTIPPQGFLLVWADKKTNTGTVDIHAGFKLSKSGTSIGLYGPDGVAVDYVTFGAMVSDVSMGRYPDGGSMIAILPSATPRTNNAAPLIVPGAPAGLAAHGGDGAVTLTWNPVGTGQAYWVKRATMDGGPYLEVASVAGTNFTDSGLVNGITYYYVVTATNQVGESEHSEQVAATPQAVIPAAPEGLAAVSGDAQVTLSWSTVSGSTSYHIKRSTVEGGPYSQIGEATETHYVDTTAQNGVLYFYVVTAVNSNGESPDSKAASAMPQISAPGVPTGLTATVTNGSVILEWNMTLTATNYSVKRATSSAGPFTVIHSGPLVTFTDSQISDGVRYYYTVSASNAGGESSDCTPVSVTAQSQLTLNVSILSDGRILLSWPLWAVDYKVMSTGDLSVSTWQPITNVVNTTASAFEVVVPTSPTNAFFRLQK